ncbi:uncharacterized protein LOC128882751 [Hylaeus volcanicus]|uniref:uncharacterized protein LOC128882751 n=1 Tax=Hylaeus volcanicus TaxID=313075 RepID=UPI0023B83FA5|nr:uncharacterized protein LOC128882751 [Hylaeus volcanicus]
MRACRLPASFGGLRLSQSRRRSRNSNARPGAWRLALANWRLELSSHAGERVAGALLPHLKRWRERRQGRLTYRATQVFTGHGCFGVYLCRIWKEAAAACHHCGEEEDSTQHTLEECPTFSAQRRVLRAQIGQDLSLPVVVGAMLESEGNWMAVVSFCEEVISQKEAAERDRELADPARRIRGRRRPGWGLAVGPPN